MDILSLEPCTGANNRKYDRISVDVCRLGDYIIFLPDEKTGPSAEPLARLYLDRIVCLMGLPNEIVSNQDNLISSTFFTTLCNLFGV